MAWTATDLANLKAAYASGVLRTRHEDRWIEYRSLEHMERAISRIETELGIAAGTPTRRIGLVYQDGKGL